MYSPEFIKPKGFKVNRPLHDEEREQHLQQKARVDDFDETVPHYQLSVIQLNSTFVEVTDRNYPVRGIGTLLTMFGMGLIGGAYLLMSATILDHLGALDGNQYSDAIFALALISLVGVPFLAASLYLFLREAFCYTHFPMRLNRKSRKVYVWRRDGTVLSVPWDAVFFCLRSYNDWGGKTWDILGHVLEADKNTVKESFAFSSYASSEAIDLRQHWEYFRRYMEDGPEQPCRMLLDCLPIAKRRETWWESFMRLLLNMNGWAILQILFLPFWFIVSLGRWIAMHTSKIPRWPDWVEQECAVTPDDPYVRESGYVAPRHKAAAA